MPLMKSVREQPEIGTHLARIVRIADLGHQPEWEWQGETNPSEYKLELTYELVNSKMKDDKPFFVSEEFKFSDHEQSTLTARLLATNCSADSIVSMLNEAVMVTIKHNPKGNAKVAGKGGVSGVPAGMPVPELTNEARFFDPYSSMVDVEEFLSFPEFKQNKFRDALDFPEMELAKKLAEEDKF